ncbi:hypothetical protein ACR6C2_13950 [Streptomyces sp. INA 01156]
MEHHQPEHPQEGLYAYDAIGRVQEAAARGALRGPAVQALSEPAGSRRRWGNRPPNPTPTHCAMWVTTSNSAAGNRVTPPFRPPGAADRRDRQGRRGSRRRPPERVRGG